MVVVVVTGVLGVALVLIATNVLGSYGWGLFAAIPFAQGTIAAYAYASRAPRTLGASVLVALFSVVVTALALPFAVAVLADLYQLHPDAKAKIKSAAGYAVFSNVGINLVLGASVIIAAVSATAV